MHDFLNGFLPGRIKVCLVFTNGSSLTFYVRTLDWRREGGALTKLTWTQNWRCLASGPRLLHLRLKDVVSMTSRWVL
jgi:hypothetical protein